MCDHNHNHHPAIGLDDFSILLREVAEEKEGVDSQNKEAIGESEEVVALLDERSSEDENPDFNRSEEKMENELDEGPRVKEEQEGNHKKTAEEEPGEVVETKECGFDFERTVDFTVVLKYFGTPVLEQISRVSSGILELDDQDNQSSESE